MSKETTTKTVHASEPKPETFTIPVSGAIANADGTSVAYLVTGFYGNGACDVSATHHSQHGNILSRSHGKVLAATLADFDSKIVQLTKTKN